MSFRPSASFPAPDWLGGSRAPSRWNPASMTLETMILDFIFYEIRKTNPKEECVGVSIRPRR